LYLAAELTLPEKLVDLSASSVRSPLDAWGCTCMGLVSGLIIGVVTEYYTSHSYSPVRELANSCETGAATNIIYGIALGNLSTVIPVVMLSLTAFTSYTLLGMFGIALAAIGMLSNLSLGLAIDAYGPVSDNAGGIAEMCEMGE
jgi:inorganic pyrophosphatase